MIQRPPTHNLRLLINIYQPPIARDLGVKRAGLARYIERHIVEYWYQTRERVCKEVKARLFFSKRMDRRAMYEPLNSRRRTKDRYIQLHSLPPLLCHIKLSHIHPSVSSSLANQLVPSLASRRALYQQQQNQWPILV